MNAQLALTLVKIAVPLVVILALYSAYLVFKLRNIDLFSNWDRNKINGGLFLLFLIGSLVFGTWGLLYYDDLYILIHNPASDHGVDIDRLFWWTTLITIFVVVLTNGALFYFAYKYSGKEGNKAAYFPENNRLEIIWTVIPAIVLTVLILSGVGTWWKVTGPAPKERIEIEIVGKQFEWILRYPGLDNKFGVITWDSINNATNNSYGYHFAADSARDDFNPQEIYLPVNVPVKVNIRAQDVLHCPTMPHFRMKIDAVPGMKTSYWFTPQITTDSMRKIRNNPKFVYELSCQEICGGGHWNMRRVIHVVTKPEYDKWVRAQKSTYALWKEGNAPAAPKTDSTSAALPAGATTPAGNTMPANVPATTPTGQEGGKSGTTAPKANTAPEKNVKPATTAKPKNT